MFDDTIAPAVFDHPNNITIGTGRILWAKACTDTCGNAHAEGWVLPGGRRTQNEVDARATALKLDQMSPKA
jgi:hypothetical protein